MAKHILRGITINPVTLAVDAIEKVGPGGQYLAQAHTRQHFRTELWSPRLMDRQMRRAWEKSGGKTMADRVRARVLSILEHHESMPIPPEVEDRLGEIVAQADERHKN
jgi:trimethylamine--corrinoid protein Co-methyltransferase